MADSFVTYTGDGSTTIFSIPFDYLDNTHVVAFVDGVETSITFPTVAQAEFSVAPEDTTNVTLKRVTPRTVREVVWQNAANLSAGDLNTSDLQLLYISQEAFDATNSNITLGIDDTFDALSKRIKNVATPTASSDAVTKDYADQNIVLTNADVASAEAAKDLSEQWASEDEDVVVASGEFSAKHYSIKSSDAKTGAELAESNAQSILTQVQVIYDDLDDRYLGVKTSDPTLDNDGDPLEDGALYYNTTDNNIRFYDLGSTTWLILDTVIGDGTVTTVKIADEAVTTDKMGDGSVSTIKLGDLSVTSGKIANTTIAFNKLATSTIASEAQSTAGTAADVLMTPQRVQQSIASRSPEIVYSDTFSSGTTIVVNGLFESGYVYTAHLENLNSSSDFHVDFDLTDGGTALTGSNYQLALNGASSSGASQTIDSSGGSESGSVRLTNNASNNASSYNADFVFNNVESVSKKPMVRAHIGYLSNGGGNVETFDGWIHFSSAGSYDGFTITISAGTISSGDLVITRLPLVAPS